jgi:hypothetical protein
MPLVFIVAAFFLSMGLVALAAPARVLGIFGVTLETAAGRTEVRAVYGGFGIGVAAVLVAASASDLRDGVLLAVAVALLGMAGGRVASGVLGDALEPWPSLFWLAVEVALAGMLLLALAL